MSDLSELYQELILDHGKSPRNFHAMDDATHTAEGFNPLCGDHVHVYLRVDENGKVTNVSFDGNGCAICTASSSLMTMEVLDHSLADARAKFEAMHDMLTQQSDPGFDEIGRMAALSGVRRFPMRVKCATLPWHTLIAALDSNGTEPVSTE